MPQTTYSGGVTSVTLMRELGDYDVTRWTITQGDYVDKLEQVLSFDFKTFPEAAADVARAIGLRSNGALVPMETPSPAYDARHVAFDVAPGGNMFANLSLGDVVRAVNNMHKNAQVTDVRKLASSEVSNSVTRQQAQEKENNANQGSGTGTNGSGLLGGVLGGGNGFGQSAGKWVGITLGIAALVAVAYVIRSVD